MAVIAQPDLQEQAHGQREADDGGEEQQHEHDAGDVGPLAQHADLDQRGAAGPEPAALMGDEHAEHRQRRGEQRRRSRAASPGRGRRPAGTRAGSSPRPAAPCRRRPAGPRRPPAGRSGSKRAPTTRAKAPSGRLIRNSARQPVPNRSALSSSPATTGPATVDSPITGPSAANALRHLGGREQVTDQAERLRGDQRGGQALQDPRGDQRRGRPGERARGGGDHETGQSPTSSIRLRPNRSPSRPPVIRPTAMASV